MFALDDVRYAYDGQTVLDLPAFRGEQGEHWLVLGRSGSGKSTLLHLMAGVLRPQHGTVVVAGEDVGRLQGGALDRFRGRHVGLVFQQLHLLPTLTVLENVLLAPYMAGLPQDRDKARAVLADLGLAGKVEAYPSALSYGQQQRAAIARAVINDPALLLADEPTSALDDVHAAGVLDLLTAQAEAHGATLVIATHDQRVKERFPKTLALDPAPVA